MYHCQSVLSDFLLASSMWGITHTVSVSHFQLPNLTDTLLVTASFSLLPWMMYHARAWYISTVIASAQVHPLTQLIYHQLGMYPISIYPAQLIYHTFTVPVPLDDSAGILLCHGLQAYLLMPFRWHITNFVSVFIFLWPDLADQRFTRSSWWYITYLVCIPFQFIQPHWCITASDPTDISLCHHFQAHPLTQVIYHPLGKVPSMWCITHMVSIFHFLLPNPTDTSLCYFPCSPWRSDWYITDHGPADVSLHQYMYSGSPAHTIYKVCNISPAQQVYSISF